MSDPVTPATDELSFGVALSELDGIVAALEGGELELEDSLARYERGVALLRALQAKLADAEQRVTMLIGELEGEAAAGAEAVAAQVAGDSAAAAPRVGAELAAEPADDSADVPF